MDTRIDAALLWARAAIVGVHRVPCHRSRLSLVRAQVLRYVGGDDAGVLLGGVFPSGCDDSILLDWLACSNRAWAVSNSRLGPWITSGISNSDVGVVDDGCESLCDSFGRVAIVETPFLRLAEPLAAEFLQHRAGRLRTLDLLLAAEELQVAGRLLVVDRVLVEQRPVAGRYLHVDDAHRRVFQLPDMARLFACRYDLVVRRARAVGYVKQGQC